MKLAAVTEFLPSVFRNDLSLGVKALARAIGVRQAATMLEIADSAARRDASIEDQNIRIFPAGDCATAIFDLCVDIEKYFEIDMAPLADLCRGLNTKKHDVWDKNWHRQLSVLASLTHGYHLGTDFTYTTEEKLSIKRFFAAIHGQLCGPLPSGVWGAEGRSIVGCPQCVNDFSDRNTNNGDLCFLLAEAMALGEIDPAYPLKNGLKFDPVTLPRTIRLGWKIDSEDVIEPMLAELTKLGFDAAVQLGWGMIYAQKPLKGKQIDAIRWSENRFERYGDNVTWYGIELIYSPTRRPLD